jgi:hypothetical protein
VSKKKVQRDILDVLNFRRSDDKHEIGSKNRSSRLQLENFDLSDEKTGTFNG